MRKILIADDVALNRMLISDMLGDVYEIVEAENGKEAIDLIGKNEKELDLIILDTTMPEMDGLEALEILNKSGVPGRIPVVVLTADVSSNVVRKAYELGARDFITRPFENGIVTMRLEALLDMQDEINNLRRELRLLEDENERLSERA